jgi:hypothetical protein
MHCFLQGIGGGDQARALLNAFTQGSHGDARASAFLEARALLKAFAHGSPDKTPVRKKKNKTSSKKKKWHNLLELLNNPIRSTVNFQYSIGTSTNTHEHLSAGLTFFDR